VLMTCSPGLGTGCDNERSIVDIGLRGLCVGIGKKQVRAQNGRLRHFRMIFT
jgi:hypothetical protein